MNESERIKRIIKAINLSYNRLLYYDKFFSKRILDLLGRKHVGEFCLVDAYLYSYDQIPQYIKDDLKIFEDAYLIFGITDKCELVCRWVDCFDLNNDIDSTLLTLSSPSFVHNLFINANPVKMERITKKDRLLWAEDRVHRLQDKLQLAFDEFYRLQDEEEEEEQEKE